MSVLRSPSETIRTSSSQPDLLNFGIAEPESMKKSIRKRKTRDDDFSQQFSEFKNEILGMFKEFKMFQICNFTATRQDLSSVKHQLDDIKTTTERLTAENIMFDTFCVKHNILGCVASLTSTVN
ncbi:unnamed protein product [Arctia plantaginis]|uniref:Uncharacterized protein n=1 Tax=Arctia plantaginis TaxID=874455 RepID=A0A8S1BHW1_ARCPL|nr:unnamed protein product [Arctia plantaginis]